MGRVVSISIDLIAFFALDTINGVEQKKLKYNGLFFIDVDFDAIFIRYPLSPNWENGPGGKVSSDLLR